MCTIILIKISQSNKDTIPATMSHAAAKKRTKAPIKQQRTSILIDRFDTIASNIEIWVSIEEKRKHYYAR